MLLMSLLALTLICWSVAVPVGREVYRMPHNALKALSDRGTVVMEAVMTRALSAVDAAIEEKSKAESNCRGCMPCLFQDCGQRTAACATAESLLIEPSCDVIGRAQSVSNDAERSWALSQVCGFYQSRCSTQDLHSASCIKTMGESCSARLLECNLINTMQNLEPVKETITQAVCGQRVSVKGNFTQLRSRIMGGSPASPGSWPWLVNLQVNGALMCGGVLVDTSWVLTAAHCFTGGHSDSDWTAVVGEFDITKLDPDEQVMKVNRIIIHPKFNTKTFNNDIALVELSSTVVFSEQVKPVCLPTNLEPPTGTPCLVAGWGSLYEDGPSADVVMEAKVPLLSQGTCKTTLGKQLLTSTMFCAGYLSGGIDSCQGDSGGPLIFQDHISGRFYLYGITSWGDGCGEKGKPGVYTRVMPYSDWILSETHKSFGSREPTCSELLKLSELSEEQRMSEFITVCNFYIRSCPSTLNSTACQHLAQDTCQSCFKKCQLHSFLQMLLDVLRRADGYIRDEVDLTSFTHSLPQLVDNIYSSIVTTRTRRHAAEEVSPLVVVRENYLSRIVENKEQGSNHDKPKQRPAVQNLFQQVFIAKKSPGGDGTHFSTPDLQQRDSIPIQCPVCPVLRQSSSNIKNYAHPQRRWRRQLLERQIHGSSNKECPGVAESAQQVIITKEMYRWILDINPSNLSMNFQEVLVDLTTKNEHGLYKARLKATVGGRLLTFYSLVGLENEAFYRSMPGIIAVALDALKT